jgi:hypothetical protein
MKRGYANYFLGVCSYEVTFIIPVNAICSSEIVDLVLEEARETLLSGVPLWIICGGKID